MLKKTKVVENSIYLLRCCVGFLIRSTVRRKFAQNELLSLGFETHLFFFLALSSTYAGTMHFTLKLIVTEIVGNLICFLLRVIIFSVLPTIIEIFAKNRMHR